MTTTTNLSASPVRRDGLLSRITGRWKSIVLLWLLIIVPVLMLIYVYIEPTFEAFGTLQVEPVTAGLFQKAEPESIDDRGVTLYLQTQVGLLKDFRVSQVDQAVAQKIPTHNDRLKYVSAAPIVVLLMLVGIFLLMPIRNESLSQSSAKPAHPGEIAS